MPSSPHIQYGARRLLFGTKFAGLSGLYHPFEEDKMTKGPDLQNSKQSRALRRRSKPSTTKRDFASLTAQEALQVAIFIEQRNSSIYRQFTELFAGFGDPDSREMAAVFEEMASEEIEHGRLLEEKYFERYGDARCTITDQDIAELVELPNLPDGNIFAIARTGASPVPSSHALKVALAAELAARRFYAFLVDVTPDPAMRDLYVELAEFEDDHVETVRRKIEAAIRKNIGQQA